VADVQDRVARESMPQSLEVVEPAITTAVTVPLMTWIVMPRVTRALRRWLYPARSGRR
jgi:antibiotic biosynthesis monooxygenase (ABM) superfamily enzyme